MSDVQQLSSSQILVALANRLRRTNFIRLAARKVNLSSDIEWEKTIFTQYYFDFSTAIEATLRGIVFEASKSGPFHSYIKYLGNPSSSKRAFFLRPDELDALTNFDFFKAGQKAIEDDFNARFKPLADPIDEIKRPWPLPINREDCKSDYELVFKTRNAIAHGLEATAVDYDSDKLCQFCTSFFFLFRFYEELESSVDASAV